MSAYYRGALFSHAVFDLVSSAWPEKIGLAVWLLHNGADLFTRQWDGYSIRQPLQALLEEVINNGDYFSNHLRQQTIQLIEEGMAKCSKPRQLYIILLRELSNGTMYIEMEAGDLCKWAVLRLKGHDSITNHERSVITNAKRTSLRVLLLRIKGVRVGTSQAPGFFRPGGEASIDLDKAIQKRLFAKSMLDIADGDFTTRFEQVAQCSERQKLGTWKIQQGLQRSRKEHAQTLDPSKDYDESTWEEAWNFAPVNDEKFL